MNRTGRGQALAAAAGLGLATVLGLLGVLTHELWRDEAYTWLVLRASGSAAALIENLGFNGHPRLYYLLCYALHRAWASPLALQLSNLALGLGATALLLRAAPLSPVQRVLYAIGFYPLYQYSVIARSYSLFLLLLFLSLALRRDGRRGAALLALAALAQVHVLGLVFSAVLLGWGLLFALGRHLRGAPLPRAVLAGAAVAGASFLLSAWQLLPPGGAARVVRPGTAQVFLDAFTAGFLPAFGLLRGSPLAYGGGLVLAALGLLCLGRGRALLVYLSLCLPLLAFFAAVYPGHRWHHGLLFVALLVSLCLADQAPGRRLSVYLSGLLGLHGLLGVYAVLEDARAPYSNGPQAAAALQAAHLAHVPLLGLEVLPAGAPALAYRFDIDQIQPLLLCLPGGQIYDPRARRFEPVWRHYSEEGYFPWIDAEAAGRTLREAAADLGGRLIVVVVLPPGAPAPLPPGLRPLATFPPTFDYGERLALYQYQFP